MSGISDVPPVTESSESDILSRLTRAVDPGNPSRVSPIAAPKKEVFEAPIEEVDDVQQTQEVDEDELVNEVDESSDEDQQDDQQEPLTELEHLGKKYKVPASLKTAFEANRAQANKIPQEIVEIRKMLHVERQAIEAQRAFEKQAKPEFDELSQIESQIAQFKGIDWSSLDTDQLVRARQALDILKDKRDDLNQKINGKRAEFGQAFKAQIEQAEKHGHAYLQKKIPNWGASEAAEVAKFAVAKGFTQEELGSLYDPRTVEVLWEAMQYQKLQSSKPQVLNKARQAPPVSKPGAVDQTNSLGKSKERVFRERLRKSGSVEDAANWLLAKQKSR